MGIRLTPSTKRMIRQHREERRVGNEWLIGYIGDWPGTPAYGTFSQPDEGHPMVVKFHIQEESREGWSRLMIVQRIFEGTYMNCIDGTIFSHDDNQVLVYSGFSRVGNPDWIQLEVRNAQTP
jgi:hypothetical protein